MRSIKDIKRVLFAAYAYGYPLAVFAPLYIDPLLKSHATYPSRHYTYWYLCIFIYALLLSSQSFLLYRATRISQLYYSVGAFLLALVISLPIFLPELPHANIVAVGTTTSIISAFTIFVWWIGRRILINEETLKSARDATFEYMKILFTFFRQAAFACVALFGALFLRRIQPGSLLQPQQLPISPISSSCIPTPDFRSAFMRCIVS